MTDEQPGHERATTSKRTLTRAQLSSPAAMEKRHYPFRNYKHAEQTVLFPGCNFMAIYPKTTRALIDLFRERIQAGFVYDCCSQPVVDMGLRDEADAIAASMEARLLKKGVRRVIAMCPNCYYRMRKTFEKVQVVDVYTALREIGWEGACGAMMSDDLHTQAAERDSMPSDDAVPTLEPLPIWQPCPDRRSADMLDALGAFLPGEPEKLRGVPCCGLKGWGRIFDAETADRFATTLAEAGDVRTYCASCIMTVARHGGTQMRHALVELLGTDEQPDIAHYAANRAKGKFA